MSETRTAAIGALIVALGPVSMALYTPAMPTLVEVLQTTPAAIKLSLSIYLFGFAFSQLVCGPLSDAFGRRPVALSSFSIYFIGSVVALLSPSIGWLLVGRALQGIGVAAGVAISRAIVRDQFAGQRSAHIMNLIGLILAVGPAISPTIGGVLLNAFGWHSIFLLMAVYGIVTVLVIGLWCVETNIAPDPAQAHPSQVARNYGMLLTDRRFMAGGLVLGFAIGAFYTLAAMLPFVLMEVVGLTPTEFGLVMLFQTGSYALGAFVTGRLLRRYEASKLIPMGLTLIAVAALSFGIGLRLLPLSWHSVIASVALWSSGSALVIPGATMIALAGFPRIAGAASALVGFLPIGIGLAGTALAALLFNDPLTALQTVMPSLGILALLAHFGLTPKRNDGAD
ncbi:multidrug effflux MFS transporter [Microvirga zambiensis]|uniref:multidrug effflux MFS transporter n=1 Tax=Microvirga zambiensis TaxID=1402137 RepID=UPI001FE6C8F4|nr:multidrug effflux MFS transporter [Microvirga zambiensis]